MCHGATCPTCSKRAWRGCGYHIPSVLDGVPQSEWCTCEPKVNFQGKDYPPAAAFKFMSWFGGGSKAKTDDGKQDDSSKGEL